MSEDQFDDILRDVQAVITGGINDYQTSEEILNTVRRAMEPMSMTNRGDYKRLADRITPPTEVFGDDMVSVKAVDLRNAAYIIRQAAEPIEATLASVQAIEYAANIASMHAHHALWNGLLPYGWDEATEQFGRNLANAIAKAIKAEVPMRLAAEPVKAGELVAWLHRHPSFGRDLQFTSLTDADKSYGWTECPLYTSTPASDVLREALVRELEACKSAVAMIEENRNPNNETQTGNYHFYRGRVVSLEFARDALAQAANQSDGDGKLPPAPAEAAVDEVALADIAAERKRQRDVEGWTSDHDDDHDRGELAQAAAAYAFYDTDAENCQPSAESLFPTTWSSSWWKPKSPRKNLVRAGALIVAEIERLDRLDAFKIGRR